MKKPLARVLPFRVKRKLPHLRPIKPTWIDEVVSGLTLTVSKPWETDPPKKVPQ